MEENTGEYILRYLTMACGLVLSSLVKHYKELYYLKLHVFNSSVEVIRK